MTKRASNKSDDGQTIWIDRFAQSIALLCASKAPSVDMCLAWMDNSSEELQQWVLTNSTVSWCSGIGTIEAAMTMADTPEDSMSHAPRVKSEDQKKWSIRHNGAGDWYYIESSLEFNHGDDSQEKNYVGFFPSYQEALDDLRKSRGAAPQIDVIVAKDDDEIEGTILFDVPLVWATTASRTVRVLADDKEQAYELASRHARESGGTGFEINSGNQIELDDVYCPDKIETAIDIVGSHSDTDIDFAPRLAGPRIK